MASNIVSLGQGDVKAVYIGTGGANISLGSLTNPYQFDSKIVDTHNAVTTGSSWKFTAPLSGVYQVSGRMFQVTTSTDVIWYIDGVAQASEAGNFTQGTVTNFINGMFYLEQGQYISMYPVNSCVQSDNATYNIIEIVKVG